MKEIIDQIFNLLSEKIGAKYQIYLVGGSTRDFLLNRKFDDFDFATDAPFDYLIEVFPHVKSSFPKYGIVNIEYKQYHITLALMREEKMYIDKRHPTIINFIDNPIDDARRRDYTINAIYIDQAGHIIDPFMGQDDLKKRIIRMIGDIPSRINEDPIRIIRAFRFEDQLGFNLEPHLEKYCRQNIWRINQINPYKLRLEYAKCSRAVYFKIQNLLTTSQRMIK
ncbi:MAG: hypothetical protein PHW22_00635 [Bacilli bacterium]|nr:hypothetical protein [Bacilli bacterium]